MKWLQIGCPAGLYYDNVPIKSSQYIHEDVMSLLTEEGVRVLDVASGEGAFSKRLYDKRFAVEAIDISDNFKYKEIIPFHKIDLNSSEWSNFVQNYKGQYDIVCSIETIEHLENPWEFLRGLSNLLKPGGRIILSTPNIESPISKMFFLLKNRFILFREKNYREAGHINPLTEYEISIICEKIGLSLEAVYPSGLYPLIWIAQNPKFSIGWSIINILFVLFASRRDFSLCKIYSMKKL